MTLEVIRDKIERFWLASQTQLEEGLEDVPTADQLLMGMLEDIPRELTYDETDFIIRKMIVRLVELQDQPKILYNAAFERFSKFVLNQCNVENMILAVNRAQHNEIRIVNTPSFDGILDITKEFT